MKKLLIGLMFLTSLSSFAAISSAEWAETLDIVKLELELGACAKTIDADDFPTTEELNNMVHKLGVDNELIDSYATIKGMNCGSVISELKSFGVSEQDIMNIIEEAAE